MRIDEENEYIKSLNANDFYFNRCMSTMYLKKLCIPIQFFDENDKENDCKILKICDYKDDTITISNRNNVIKIALDGTNFISKIATLHKGDKNTYMYKNDALGIEYKFLEENIGDDVYMNTLIKKVKDFTISIRYCQKDDYTLLLDYLQTDDKMKSCIRLKNIEDSDSSKNELIHTVNEDSEITKEMKHDSMIESAIDKYGEDSEELQEFEEYLFNRDNEKENSEQDEFFYDQVGEYFPDENIVYFESQYGCHKDNIVSKHDDYLPVNCQDFEYSKYVEKNKTDISEQQKNIKNSVDEQESEDDIMYKVYEEIMEISVGNMVNAIDSDLFHIVMNGEIVEDDDVKQDLLDGIYETVSEEHEEIIDLVDYIEEMEDDVDKIYMAVRAGKEKAKSTENQEKDLQDSEEER